LAREIGEDVHAEILTPGVRWSPGIAPEMMRE